MTFGVLHRDGLLQSITPMHRLTLGDIGQPLLLEVDVDRLAVHEIGDIGARDSRPAKFDVFLGQRHHVPFASSARRASAYSVAILIASSRPKRAAIRPASACPARYVRASI